MEEEKKKVREEVSEREETKREVREREKLQK